MTCRCWSSCLCIWIIARDRLPIVIHYRLSHGWLIYFFFIFVTISFRRGPKRSLRVAKTTMRSECTGWATGTPREGRRRGRITASAISTRWTWTSRPGWWPTRDTRWSTALRAARPRGTAVRNPTSPPSISTPPRVRITRLLYTVAPHRVRVTNRWLFYRRFFDDKSQAQFKTTLKLRLYNDKKIFSTIFYLNIFFLLFFKGNHYIFENLHTYIFLFSLIS